MSVFSFETREEFIREVFPNGRPTKVASGDLLRDNTMDWSVSRKRLLEAAISSADEEQVKIILNDFAVIVGIDGAIETFFSIWGNMVQQSMEDDEDPSEE